MHFAISQEKIYLHSFYFSGSSTSWRDQQGGRGLHQSHGFEQWIHRGDYRAAQTIEDYTTVNQVLVMFEKAVEECVETYALDAQVLNDQQDFESVDSYAELDFFYIRG